MVVIGIIAILAAVALVAVNPARQFASARDTQRRNDVYQLVSAVYQYSVENRGYYPDPLLTAGATPADIGSDELNLAAVLVPGYLPKIPVDPNGGTVGTTKYLMFLSDDGLRVTASAAGELDGEEIKVTR